MEVINALLCLRIIYDSLADISVENRISESQVILIGLGLKSV